MQAKFTINEEASELNRSRITQARLYLVDNNQIDNNSDMNFQTRNNRSGSEMYLLRF